MSRKGQAHAEKVWAILEEHLPALDPDCKDLVLPLVEEHYDDRQPYEIIIDHPIIANWRLKSLRSTGKARLADYRWPERNDGLESIINALIQS